MKKKTRNVVFEADEHITKEAVFETSYAMFESLKEGCPGCAMKVISVLLTMLAIEYIKQGEQHKEIFVPDKWMDAIVSTSRSAINSFERTGTTVN